MHLATIWAVAVGGVLSAAFIMAANSWMQRPVGYQLNAAGDRAQLTDIWAVLTNIVFLWAYLHVVAASLVTAPPSCWRCRPAPAAQLQPRHVPAVGQARHHRADPGTMLALFFGGRLGINETTYQPGRDRAAEGQWTTCQPCSFSVFQIGGGNNDPTPKIIEIPHLLSVLATGTWNGQVVGLNSPVSVRAAVRPRQLHPQHLHPVLVDAGHGLRGRPGAAGGALRGAWLLWRKKLATARWYLPIAIWVAVLPFLMNTAGWL